jgi:phospholipid/cholesterol/gamma-HCH transport system substrate-binding protein
MENRAHALAAGLFTLALFIAAVLSVYLFGEKSTEMREYLVVTRQNVSGLNPQAQVRYRGIRVGKVLDIALDKNDVRNIFIKIAIDKDIPITKGTTASLAYQGVTGIAQILLEDDGSNPERLSGKLPRIYAKPSFMAYLEDALPSLISDAKALMHNASGLLDDQNRKALSETILHAAEISKQSEAAIGRINRLLSDENIAALSEIARQAPPLMHDTRTAAKELAEAAGRANALLAETQEGSGGGLALRASQTLDNFSDTAAHATRVLEAVEARPQSLVFGAPPPAPGPGEPGFAAGKN